MVDKAEQNVYALVSGDELRLLSAFNVPYVPTNDLLSPNGDRARARTWYTSLSFAHILFVTALVLICVVLKRRRTRH